MPTVLDPGHAYQLDILDGPGCQVLVFVKRDDPPEKYPGNEGHYPGVIVQEVLRVLIDRVKYVDSQDSADENTSVLIGLRLSFLALEERAHRRHDTELPSLTTLIEEYDACPKCGHILCTWCEHEVV